MKLFSILFLLYLINDCTSFFDPISLSVIGGLGGMGYGLYKSEKFRKYTICMVMECCNEDNIPFNVDGLNDALKEKLFGQDLARETLIAALLSHKQNFGRHKKPLVLSFHGHVGAGKNYVADFIAEYLFKQGSSSKFVKKYESQKDFPLKDDIEQYKSKLLSDIPYYSWICSKTLFIFDEVDKAPEGLFDVLAPMLDYRANAQSVDLTNSIFIFISNSGSKEITNELDSLLDAGYLRSNVKLKNFEKHCQIGAYNFFGGFRKSYTIEKSVIDHFIPFLPLERSHVEQCIVKEFEHHHTKPTNNEILTILEEVAASSESSRYLTSGCKRVDKKVQLRLAYRDLDIQIKD